MRSWVSGHTYWAQRTLGLLHLDQAPDRLARRRVQAQIRLEREEQPLEDARHAGQDAHVPVHAHDRHPVLARGKDHLGVLREERHAVPRARHLFRDFGLAEAVRGADLHAADRLLVVRERDASKSLCERLVRDVVGRGADPAAGDDPVVRARQALRRFGDRIGVIGDHLGAPQLDAELEAELCELVAVGIERLAVEHLVADDQASGRPDERAARVDLLGRRRLKERRERFARGHADGQGVAQALDGRDWTPAGLCQAKHGHTASS